MNNNENNGFDNLRELARMVTQYLMRAGMILGMWFVVEYLVFVQSQSHIIFSLLHAPMMLVTPVLLFILIKKMRNVFFQTRGFRFSQVVIYSSQLMFFAGLIEAIFIYAYNQWLYPGNLLEMRDALIAQYDSLSQTITQMGSTLPPSLVNTFNEARQILAESDINRPIEVAINALSNDVFYGLIWAIPFGLILKRRTSE
ncbi:MAG: DUF4199 domain-containing protein [Bacteroidales bacterium]|nr:DUF4199 domain-containing protein [Candidatus Liminaster caballi]